MNERIHRPDSSNNYDDEDFSSLSPPRRLYNNSPQYSDASSQFSIEEILEEENKIFFDSQRVSWKSQENEFEESHDSEFERLVMEQRKEENELFFSGGDSQYNDVSSAQQTQNQIASVTNTKESSLSNKSNNSQVIKAPLSSSMEATPTVVEVSPQPQAKTQPIEPLNVANLSTAEKLGFAMKRAAMKLPKAVGEQLLAMINPASLATMVGVLGAYAASHAVGIGFIADAVMAVSAGALIGWQAVTAAKDLWGFAQFVNATTEEDLDKAGQHLASFVATVGIDIVLGILTKKAAGKVLDEAATNKVASRGRNTEPLTPAQIDEVKSYARELGIPEDSLSFTDGNTYYGNMFGHEIVKVGPDVAPLTNPPNSGVTANSRISLKGSLAHEWIGHGGGKRASRNFQTNIPGTTKTDLRMNALEEAQASIRAARFAPNLTLLERYTLLRDAINRLKNQGIKIREVKHLLFIDEM